MYSDGLRTWINDQLSLIIRAGGVHEVSILGRTQLQDIQLRKSGQIVPRKQLYLYMAKQIVLLNTLMHH
jgi:hypothetical protein